jgi:hypothetical protein
MAEGDLLPSKIYLVINPANIQRDKSYLRHDTFDSAMREAHRLSLGFAGQDFMVVEIDPNEDATVRCVDGRVSWFERRSVGGRS